MASIPLSEVKRIVVKNDPDEGASCVMGHRIESGVRMQGGTLTPGKF